jgi:2-keto-3-deoxy-6-phosphogluconate aldolase
LIMIVPSTLSPILPLSAIRQRIEQMGLIARLPVALPIADLLHIGDALLAAPLLVVEIPDTGDTEFTILREFRARFGAHLICGVADLHSDDQIAAALAAGAHYIVTAEFSPGSGSACERAGALYLPTIANAMTVESLTRAHCSGVRLAVGESPQAETLSAVRALVAGGLLVTVGPAGEWMAYARTGASVVLERALFPDADWSLPGIITQARQFRARWEAARQL